MTQARTRLSAAEDKLLKSFLDGGRVGEPLNTAQTTAIVRSLFASSPAATAAPALVLAKTAGVVGSASALVAAVYLGVTAYRAPKPPTAESPPKATIATAAIPAIPAVEETIAAGPAVEEALAANATVAPAPALTVPAAPQVPISLKSRAKQVAAEHPFTAQVRLLGEALTQLRQESDPERALETLRRHEQLYPASPLHAEVKAAQVEAELKLEHDDTALELLDGMEDAALAGLPQGESLRVLRGELLSRHGRCSEAIQAFAPALSGAAERGLQERALWGTASCHRQLGESDLARERLQEYLERFPNGRFAEHARGLVRP